MITRIRPCQFLSIARSSKAVIGPRAFSSTAGPSKPPGQPRNSDSTHEYTVAPDPSVAFSRGNDTPLFTRGSAVRPRHDEPRHEAPVLKANPYADTYRIREDELAAEDMEEASEASLGHAGTPENGTLDPVRRSALRRPTRNTGSSGPESQGNDELAEQIAACHWWMNFGRTRVGIAPRGLLYSRKSSTGMESHRIISYHRLRDACPCPKCIDPSTRQRTHTSPEAYHEIENSDFAKSPIRKGLISREASDEGTGLRIDWSKDHSVFYPLSRIRELATGEHSGPTALQHAQRVFWDKDRLLGQGEKLYVQYENLARPDRDQALLDTLTQLQRFGIVVIKGVPTKKTGDDDCTLREVMAWIGELRNTFYGETWNVKNVANSKNVAYTNLNLGLHMDLLYFSSPPRFQALHCLRNRVEGGSSYFVDGFAAAHQFFAEGGQNFRIEYAYDNDSHYLRHMHRLVDGPLPISSHVKTALNWSPPFQSAPRLALGGTTLDQQVTWYEQLAAFEKILNEPQRKWEFLMEEGDLVLFDNRRVLHARKAFRDLSEAEAKERGVKVVQGEPSRWLKGCYLDGEVVWDKLVTLARKLEMEKGKE